jgi:hypothetical protein
MPETFRINLSAYLRRSNGAPNAKRSTDNDWGLIPLVRALQIEALPGEDSNSTY